MRTGIHTARTAAHQYHLQPRLLLQQRVHQRLVLVLVLGLVVPQQTLQLEQTHQWVRCHQW